MKGFSISLVLFFVLSSLFFVSTKSHAETSCQPIYGGGQTCISTGSISIDKKVLNVQTQTSWVDNLGINDGKFQPGNTINFQINLTNTGNTEIKHIDVKDVFPQFVSYSAGPGNFDANTKTLSFGVDNLKASETRTFIVVGKVVGADSLPIDLGVICMVNQATATTTDAGTSQDNAQFCIQKPSQASQKQVLSAQTSKGGFPVFPAPTITTSPATGGELLPIISLIPTGIIGFFLRKKAIKNNHSKLR